MTTKLSLLFNGQNNDGSLVFGFSETWYHPAAAASAVEQMHGIIAKRMEMLPQRTALFGYRAGDVAPGSRATVHPVNLAIAGTMGNVTGTPTDAFLYGIRGCVPNTFKRGWLHNASDELIVGGNFANRTTAEGFAGSWINGLAEEGFQFRYKVANDPATQGNILWIDDVGNVRLDNAIVGLTLQSVVQVIRCRDTNGKAVKGNYALEAITSGSQFKLRNWTANRNVNLSGKIRLVVYAYTPVALLGNGRGRVRVLIRIGDRKVGRPFGQLRGRVTARR